MRPLSPAPSSARGPGSTLGGVAIQPLNRRSYSPKSGVEIADTPGNGRVRVTAQFRRVTGAHLQNGSCKLLRQFETEPSESSSQSILRPPDHKSLVSQREIFTLAGQVFRDSRVPNAK